MAREFQSEMIEVQMECDLILPDDFGGVVSPGTLRAADGMMRSLKSYDRGTDFGRMAIREFNERAEQMNAI